MFGSSNVSPPSSAHLKPLTMRNSMGTTYPMTPMTISHQPPSTKMSLNNSDPSDEGREQTVDGVLRLRGGCIPCPDGSRCYIIPIPCCC
ncbi:hypothetical protein CPB86DRAFT_789178 [Serendipita vermifera]|nr:hypothetical protein CPB86DRAFT_789178 [Serendipita vermifera]